MLNKKLKELRSESGLTQEELAKYIHVTTSSIGMYESGVRKPSYEVITKLADFYKVSIDYLLGRSEFKNNIERNFKFLSENFTKDKIDKLISNYPSDIQKCIYSLLMEYLQIPMISIKYNFVEQMFGKDVDWLYLVTKTLEILTTYILDLKSIFCDDKASCYYDMFSLRDVEELHDNVLSIISDNTPSITPSTLDKASKYKALAKMRLEIIIEQIERLALYGNHDDILFKDEILEYTNASAQELNKFSKLIKDDISNFLDDILDMRKYTTDKKKDNQ